MHSVQFFSSLKSFITKKKNILKFLGKIQSAYISTVSNISKFYESGKSAIKKFYRRCWLTCFLLATLLLVFTCDHLVPLGSAAGPRTLLAGNLTGIYQTKLMFVLC